MDKNRIAKKDGRARRTNNVREVERKYISPDYELTLCSANEIGDTGRLNVGALKPKRKRVPPQPWFGLRWDEKATAIDVDAYDCTSRECSSFRRDAQGYLGHHTAILNTPGRVAEWKLIWKSVCLYHGTIECPVAREVNLGATAGVSETAEYQLQRRCHLCRRYFTVHNDENVCPSCTSEEVTDLSGGTA